LRFLIQAFIAAFMLLLFSSIAAQENMDDFSEARQRLKTGAFYYHYLDNDYQKALNYLGQINNMSAGSESKSEMAIMQAAIYLSMGLTRDAEAIYNSIGENNVSADAWFYLARAWQRSADWIACENSIRKALSYKEGNNPLSTEYSDEAYFLLISSLAEQDRLSEAENLLTAIPLKSVWAGYAKYNLIIAHIRLFSPTLKVDALVEEATYYLPDSYEGRALRDRIFLVAGINALNNGKNAQAADLLKQISLDSAFTAPGLLQYGWALTEQFHYEEAMQPWRILQQKYQPFHPAVMESVLAVPHALELLNATTQSLKTYEMAEQRLQTMLTHLQQQNNPQLIRQWLNKWLAGQTDQWGMQNASDSDMPDDDFSATLQALLDNPEFINTIAQLHDLSAMRNALTEQQENMQQWQITLQRRQQALKSLDGQKRLLSLQRRQVSLTDKVQQLKTVLQQEDEKLFAYASVTDKKNIENLQPVVPEINYLQQISTPTRDLENYKERWRRVRGVQLWLIYENKPQRRWDVNVSYWKLQSLTAELMQQLNNTREALSWADSSWKGFPQQVTDAQKRISQLQTKVQQAWDIQYYALETIVADHLNALEQRITDYQAQARLSVARLYDDALQQQLAAEVSQAGNNEQRPATVKGGGDE